VLLADEDLTNMEIVDHAPLNQMTIGVWLNRFIEENFHGIVRNRPRGATMIGARNDSNVKLRQQIIEIAITQKLEGGTHWSTRTLAAKLGTNSMFVSRVYRPSYSSS